MADPNAGLDDAAVRDRVLQGEANEVPQATGRTVGQIVRANLFTPFNALLGTLFVLILVVGAPQDALFGVVLVANTAIGIFQELRAKRTLDRLAVLTAPRARVVRAGRSQEIPVGEVVLDDVLELRPGDQVVVDGEVLVSTGLEVDESLVSGESEPTVKEAGVEVLSGSFVAAGSGRYRATRVGQAAYASSLAEQAKRFTLVRSELRSGINRILLYVTWAIVPTAALLFVSQFRLHDSWHDAVSGAVAGTVGMVPEGLVLLTSVAFGVAVMRLARKRVLVQELPAVEGLARVDVLCTDKTGTLTEGHLQVQDPLRLSRTVRSACARVLCPVEGPRREFTVRAHYGGGDGVRDPWTGHVEGLPDRLRPGRRDLPAHMGVASAVRNRGLKRLRLGRRGVRDRRPALCDLAVQRRARVGMSPPVVRPDQRRGRISLSARRPYASGGLVFAAGDRLLAFPQSCGTTHDIECQPVWSSGVLSGGSGPSRVVASDDAAYVVAPNGRLHAFTVGGRAA